MNAKKNCKEKSGLKKEGENCIKERSTGSIFIAGPVDPRILKILYENQKK